MCRQDEMAICVFKRTRCTRTHNKDSLVKPAPSGHFSISELQDLRSAGYQRNKSSCLEPGDKNKLSKTVSTLQPSNEHHLKCYIRAKDIQQRSEHSSFTARLRIALTQLNYEFSSYIGLFITAESSYLCNSSFLPQQPHPNMHCLI